MFQKLRGLDSRVFKVWTSAQPLLVVNDICQSLCLQGMQSRVYSEKQAPALRYCLKEP